MCSPAGAARRTPRSNGTTGRTPPYRGVALRSDQPSQLVQSMTMFYRHPASAFQRTTARDAQIQAWRSSARSFLGRGITAAPPPRVGQTRNSRPFSYLRQLACQESNLEPSDSESDVLPIAPQANRERARDSCPYRSEQGYPGRGACQTTRRGMRAGLRSMPIVATRTERECGEIERMMGDAEVGTVRGGPNLGKGLGTQIADGVGGAEVLVAGDDLTVGED